MKTLLILVLAFCAATNFAQEAERRSDLEKLVETENAFAKAVETKGISPAFIEYLTDDAVMFSPAQINGKKLWRGRAGSPALLTWYPTFVDVSSNGALGYTVGAGEYRAKGKADATVYYSAYASIWRRQPDGSFKAVMDVGVSHGKPPIEDRNWKSPANAAEKSVENKTPAANQMSQFYDAATRKGLSKAYGDFAAADAQFLREGKFSIVGKSNAPTEPKKSKISFGKAATMQSAGDLGYSITTYEMKNEDKITERGNIIQVWKLIGGRWQIVLDVFAPIPPEQK